MNQRKNTCPICHEPATSEDRPFCSQRCRDIDLSRWLNDAYVLPSEEPAPLSEPSNDNHDRR